jgi:multidrug efflux pump subunit AcrA (membrane-fusion protein)
MQETFYRFIASSQVEVETPRGRVYVFSSPRSGERCSLRANEYELARLFTGARSGEEVRDIVLRTHNLNVSAEALEAFVVKLEGLGLLQRVAAPAAPPRPPWLDFPQVAAPSPPALPAPALPALIGPALRRAQARPERPALEAEVIRGGGGTARKGARHPGGRPAVPPADLDEDMGEAAAGDAEQIVLDQLDAFPEALLGTAGGGGRGGGTPRQAAHTADPADEGFAPGLAQRVEMTPRVSSPAAARRPAARSGPRLLVRLPVAWLLPLAAPLAWAAWSGYLAALLAVLLGVELAGLWNARVELMRDIRLWAEPLNVAQTLLIAALTLNLWSQLARAAEFKRRLGRAPPFGIALAHNILPVFVADVWGMGQRRDPDTPPRVIGASVSAAATICLLAYAGWFALKNNGTSLPLLCLGVAAIATVRLLLSLNPLGRSDGYFLMALKLGLPDLRERAFIALVAALTFKPMPRAWGRTVPRSALLAYALAVLAFIVTVFVLLTLYVGGWLEANWGGFGVAVFLALVVLAVSGPVAEARRRLAVRPARVPGPWPRERTLGQRLRSMGLLTLVLGTLTFVGLLPYRYEPGGDFLLRPLQANRTDVRSLISGRVQDLLVREGDLVEKNQLLARLSDDEERKNVESTAANIRELEAQLAKALAGATTEAVDVARQKVSAARTRHQYSQSKAERWAQLRDSGFVSPQDYENVRGEADNDREQLLQAEKELAQLLAGTRKEEIEALRASIDQQKANLQYHTQRTTYGEIRAPIAGYVVSGSLITAAGNYLKEGDLLLTIENASQLVAEIKVPQFDIQFTQLGASIRMKAWTLPDVEIEGRVASIAPSAEETPAGKMVRVTSEIDNGSGILKSGMTGYAKIDGGEMPTALAFTRWIVRFIQIEFWSWLP